jgi:polar amino acid transport system substrate-binding protein
MVRRNLRSSVAAVAVLALLAAACGDGDTDEPEVDDTEASEEADDDAADDEEADDATEDGDEQAAGIPGCEVDTLNLIEEGKLTVGTGDPVFPPWMLDDDPAGGEGFENGLVYELAAELGFDADDVVWIGQTFEEAIAPGTSPTTSRSSRSR